MSPTITPHARPTPSSPVIVVVDISTSLTISNFATLYPGAPSISFHPAYHALSDGSLVAPPFRSDLALNNALLIVTGSLLSIFLHNLYKAAIYLWRGKVKKKGLLYTLFLSQLLGPVAVVPIIVAQFSTSPNCSVILRIFFIASGLSLSLLITGVFGVKAYRCLDNSRLVSAVLLVLRAAGSAVLILDLIRIHSFRGLSGRCYSPSPGLSSVFVILLIAESSFICACFFYAARKSHGPVAVRGRISVPLSFDDIIHTRPTEPRKKSADSVLQGRRRWSDDRPHTNHFSSSWHTPFLSPEPSIASISQDEFRRMYNFDTFHTDAAQSSRRPIQFPCTIRTPPPAPHSWAAGMPMTTEGRRLPKIVPEPFEPPTFSAHSRVSRFTRYIPRMSLFREVMRDELCYTAVTVAFTIVFAAMILVGVKGTGGIDNTIWVAFDWALISLLIIHSFGRAIRRHENESLLLHPAAKYRDLHTDRTTAELLGDGPQPAHTREVLSRACVRRSVTHNDLYGSASSALSMRCLFPGSAHSSRGDLHSLTASTSGTSNVLPSVENGSFSRTQVSSTICMEDVPSCPHKLPKEWFDKDLVGVLPPPEPPDDGWSRAASADALP